jgi:hypothetical protein
MKQASIGFVALVILLVSSATSQAEDNAQQPQMYWTKHDYTQQAFNADKYTCLQSSIAQSQPNAVMVPDSNATMLQMINQQNLFNACMEFKGYTLQSAASIQAKPTPPPVTNEHVAYCLRAKELGLDMMQKANHETGKSKDAINMIFNGIRGSIKADKNRLAANELYFPDSNTFSSSIEPQLNQAKIDFDESMHSEYKQCMSGCSIGDAKTEEVKQYVSCSQECSKLMNDADHRYTNCILEAMPNLN